MAIEIPPATTEFVHGFLAALKYTLPYSEEYKGLNFSDSPVALIVNVAVVAPGGLFLALRRTAKNDSGVGEYNNVAGYMQGRGDGGDPIETTVENELNEETGLSLEDAASARVGSPFEVQAPDGRVIHVVPGLVIYDRVPRITLNEEHDEFGWVMRHEFRELPRLAVVDRVFDTMLVG